LRILDPKYQIVNETIVNNAGVPIPEDEPLILFRARDRNALAMLRHYRLLCEEDLCTAFHMDGIDNRIAAFAEFKHLHPERMKQPGITRGK